MNSDASVLIRPTNSWFNINFRELWKFRELLYFLVWRDLKVRYKRTLLGITWVIVQPLFSMIVFTIFLGKLAKVPSDGIPYPIFAYSGLIVWQIFARAISEGSTSLSANEHILTKVYFPRVLIPISTVLTSLADFGISLVLLCGMIIYYRIVPGAAILTFPIFLLLAVITAASVALWLSALSSKYRDIRYTLPFVSQFWFFISPIIYPSSLVPGKWRWLYGANPVTGVIEGFRYALIGKPISSVPMLAISAGLVLVLFVTGALYFIRTEKTLADII